MLSAEVIEFADLTDDALAIRRKLEFILKLPVPVHILTDSKSLFDIIFKRSITIEKRSCRTYMLQDRHIRRRK